jgi:fatty-acid desaturase
MNESATRIDENSATTNAIWERPWYKTDANGAPILFWISLIHVTALIGLVLYPLPPWPVLVGAVAIMFLGGLGTTVGYHRAIAHRSVTLNPWVQNVLIFFAVFNGSGNPLSWAAHHRLHHAKADTPEDISSPLWGGFWWSHMRWLWQMTTAPIERYCTDLNTLSYRAWRVVQGPILALSYLGGLYFGWAAFFWLGAIRLCFALHAQSFVNSICHTEPGIQPGQDSSRNVKWLALVHLFQGENWHRNHHARPGSARLGWNWRQPDAGWLVIIALERLGLATDVRRPGDRRRVATQVGEALDPAA